METWKSMSQKITDTTGSYFEAYLLLFVSFGLFLEYMNYFELQNKSSCFQNLEGVEQKRKWLKNKVLSTK